MLTCFNSGSTILIEFFLSWLVLGLGVFETSPTSRVVYAGKVGEFSRFYANLTPVFLQTLSLSSSLLLLALAVQLTVSSDYAAAATKGISMSSPLKILNAWGPSARGARWRMFFQLWELFRETLNILLWQKKKAEHHQQGQRQQQQQQRQQQQRCCWTAAAARPISSLFHIIWWFARPSEQIIG